MPSASTSSNTSPPNPHTTDAILQPFLGPSFDPTAYLNANLPPLAVPTANQPIIPAKSLSISDLSSRTQTHIAQLSAQSTRLSDTLTDLTDAILRSGPRLAYNVELLRGEANALADTLAETLADEIKVFVPEGLDAPLDPSLLPKESGEEDTTVQEQDKEEDNTANGTSAKAAAAAVAREPPDLERLRTLHLVRSRLQAVTKVFDAALAWPLPPSSLSITQSFVSVSGPADTGGENSTSLEERGQAAQKELRESVTELLAPNGRSAGAEGVLRAEERVRGLRALAEVWRGTAEEKARFRFVEGLEKMVADRRKEEESRGTLKEKEEAEREAQEAAVQSRRGGLFGGLRRLREEIYLE